MATKKAKAAPVKAKPRAPRVRTVSVEVEHRGDVTIVTEIAEVNAPSFAPAQVGRADRHPRTGRPRAERVVPLTKVARAVGAVAARWPAPPVPLAFGVVVPTVTARVVRRG